MVCTLHHAVAGAQHRQQHCTRGQGGHRFAPAQVRGRVLVVAAGQEAVADEESLTMLQGVIEELPPGDKLLIELAFLKELPADEVAGILHISLTAFYTRKNRVIGKMRKIAEERKIL